MGKNSHKLFVGLPFELLISTDGKTILASQKADCADAWIMQKDEAELPVVMDDKNLKKHFEVIGDL